MISVLFTGYWIANDLSFHEKTLQTNSDKWVGVIAPLDSLQQTVGLSQTEAATYFFVSSW